MKKGETGKKQENRKNIGSQMVLLSKKEEGKNREGRKSKENK